MPRETDLLRVKLVAHPLLDAQIQETALSPVIVSHPFTNSGISALRNEDGSLSMVDLINNSDDCTRWRRKVGEQIDSAENVHQIFVLLNPPYYLTFIKFAASDLSEKDLGQLLCALPGFVDSKNEEKTERNAGYLVVSHSGGGMLRQGTRKGIRRTPANRGMRAHWCALPGFVDSKNEEKTERNAGYLVVSHSGGGMLRQGTREGIRRTPANRGMRAHRVVKGLDISEDVCHGLCP